MNADTLPRIPHNAEAERSILGVLILAPSRIGEAAERLGPQEFFFSIYRKLYSAILELDSAGKTPDSLTLHEVLARDEELSDAGGIAFIFKLTDGLYTKAPLGDYCRIVKEAADLSRVLAIRESTTARISEGGRAAEVIDSVAADFDSIRDDNRSLERGPVHVSIVTRELVPMLERAAN